MAGKWNGKRCSTCGVGTLHDGVRERTNDYRGHTFAATYTGAFCDRCGDGMIYHQSKIDDEWDAFCAHVDTNERRELAAIRARLGLTQEDASKLSGGGHNAFSRYERGEAKPMMAVMNLFRLLDRYPSLLPELGAAHGTISSRKPTANGWYTMATRHSGRASTRLVVSIPDAAANEWHSSTDRIGLASEAV